jgi:putative DNA primase/helicase
MKIMADRESDPYPRVTAGFPIGATMEKNSEAIRSEAIRCTERGWYVIPLYGIHNGQCECQLGKDCKSPGKHPRIKDWKERATKERRVIDEWWTKWPNANLGVVAGSKSGIVVLDVDPRHDGNSSIEKIEEESGRVESPVESITGGGGRHIYYLHPGGYVKSKNGIMDGLDIKADGGFVVVPPSIHVTGKHYQWNMTKNGNVGQFPLMPIWLEQAINSKSVSVYHENANEIIPEGKRNSTLTSIAGRLRRQGLSEDAIFRDLIEINEDRCMPPLNENEIRNISKSIARYDNVSSAIDLTKINCTDSGNAELIAALYGDRLRYDHTKKLWLSWNGQIWRPDLDGDSERKALSAAKERYRHAEFLRSTEEKKRHAKWAIESESDFRIKAALNRSRCHEVFSKQTSDFNQDPWLLGCTNGIVNLKTGELRPGRPQDMITLSTGIEFDPKAKAPRFQQFLAEVFSNNREVIDFIQRFVGYSLVGLIPEQVFCICLGNGSNGKSVFLNCIRGILGEYATNIPFTTFESTKHNTGKNSNDVAALEGKRLVTVSEVCENSRWNEGIIKSVTGGDQVKCRFLYKEYFEYTPQFTLWFGVNHKPKVSDTSDAFWRRVRIIEFPNTFTGDDRDNNLMEILKEEYPGILAWAVEGCLKWQEKGLDEPNSVIEATKEYRTEEDIFQQFIKEMVTFDETSNVQAQTLYKNYREWCENWGVTPISGIKFWKKMRETGFKNEKHGPDRTSHYMGIRV